MTPPVLSFEQLVARLTQRLGKDVAQKWLLVITKHQRHIDFSALVRAVQHHDSAAIQRVLRVGRLQKDLEKALATSFANTVRTTGHVATLELQHAGIGATFSAVHPNIVHWARENAAELVRGIAAETKRVVAEVIAVGQEDGLTTVQMARAIREVVGLPANWAQAPQALAREIRKGKVSAATRRRLSAVDKQRIRSRVRAGTNDANFAQEMANKYAKSLVNQRAQAIARTETQRAVHQGLVESWTQARQKGVLPSTIRRFWIVTPDDRLCPICRRIPQMNPDGRALTEPFMTPHGPVMLPPAPHPHCRCTIALLLKRKK